MLTIIHSKSYLDIQIQYQNMTAKKILVINPNSTSSMTDGLKPLVNALKYKEVSKVILLHS
jgi:hypothetical protein